MSTSPAFDAEEVARTEFATGFRGYDQQEVRAFLGRLAEELDAARARERALAERLAQAEAQAGPRELSAAELEEALGAETAKVLHAARVAAAEIRGRTEEQVARLLREATAENTRLRQEAAALVEAATVEDARLRQEAAAVVAAAEAEAGAKAAAIVAEAGQAAQAQREAAETEAAATIESAKERGREMVGEAKALRERVLRDLDRRRRAGQAELEQLLVGRDRMLEGCRSVQAALDAAVAELEVAEPAARAAARAAGSRTVVAEQPLEAEVAEAVASGDVVVARAAGAAAEAAEEPERAVAEVEAEGPEDEVEAAEAAGTGGPEAGEAEAEVPADDPEPSETAAPAPASAAPPVGVEDVLARFRSDRAATVAHATRVLAGSLGEPAGEPPPPAPPVPAASRPAAHTAPDGVEPSPAGEDRGGDAASSEVVSDFERRDAAVEPHERSLSRALKRALADEQNELLDALRRTTGARTVDALLGPAAARAGSHRDRAAPILAAAAADGAGGVDVDVRPQVTELAEALGQEVATALGHRLERALASGAGDELAVNEAISAVYREWRSARAEPLARHHVAAAWAAGAYAAAGDRSLVWVVDPDTGCSPDCADNTLAGPTAKGEVFPTGHLHPPAHPGCRCLVAAPNN